MSIDETILLAAIGLMLYGVIQNFIRGDEFWFFPTGNIIGAIGVTVVASAAFPLTLQADTIVLVAVALGLYWFTKTKRTPKRQTFEQVFETVEVEPVVEPKVEAEPVVEYAVEDEPEPIVEANVEHSPFMWNGA